MEKSIKIIANHLNREYYELERMFTKTLALIGSYTLFTEETEDEQEDIMEFTDYDGNQWKIMGFRMDSSNILIKAMSCEDGDVHEIPYYMYDKIPVHKMLLMAITDREFPEED